MTEDISEVEPELAAGGNTWKRPQPTAYQFEWGQPPSEVLRICTVLILPLTLFGILFGLGLSFLMAVFAPNGVPISEDSSGEQSNHSVQWEDEYGYQSVVFPEKITEENVEGVATVTDSVGQTLEVGVFVHKNAVILYNSPEQLGQKIVAVDEGTYPEELYLTYKEKD